MIIIAMTLNAQYKVGFIITPAGYNEVFQKIGLDGAPSYSGDGFYTFGITCQFPVVSCLDMEIGLDYSKHTIEITPNLPPDPDNIPNNIPYKSSLNLISIPITLKIDFLKYLFVNGGCLLDIDTNSSSPIYNQTGLGAILGLGIKYDFSFGGTIFVNPYLKGHSLVPFSPGNYHERLFESGIRIGFLYNLF